MAVARGLLLRAVLALTVLALLTGLAVGAHALWEQQLAHGALGGGSGLGIPGSGGSGGSGGNGGSPTASGGSGSTAATPTQAAAASPPSTASDTGSVGSTPTATPLQQQALHGTIVITNQSGRLSFSAVVRPVSTDLHWYCGNYGTAGQGEWNVALEHSGQSGDSTQLSCYIYVSTPSTLPKYTFSATVIASNGATALYTNPQPFTPCWSSCL